MENRDTTRMIIPVMMNKIATNIGVIEPVPHQG
jgi:hypothetical protein